MTADLKELERLARAATPGEWTFVSNSWDTSTIYDTGNNGIAQCLISSSVTEETQDVYEPIKEANAAYIAAANPAVTLSLIAELEQCRRVVRSVKQEAETALVIGDEIGMRDGLTQILSELDAAIAKEYV